MRMMMSHKTKTSTTKHSSSITSLGLLLFSVLISTPTTMAQFEEGSQPICYLCHDGGVSSITKPDNLVPLPEFVANMFGVGEVRCGTLRRLAEKQLRLPEEWCAEFDRNDFRLQCGCANAIPTQAPGDPPDPKPQPKSSPATPTSSPSNAPTGSPTNSAAPSTSVPPSYSDAPVSSNDCQVDFVLWNADTDAVVGLMQNQLNEDGDFCLPAYNINFEARPTADCNDRTVESAYLTLDGPTGGGTEGNDQNTIPFTLYGENPKTGDIYAGDVPLQAGVSYLLGADFYSERNLGGSAVLFGEYEFTTKACNDDANPPEGGNECAIEYLLLDADRNAMVGMLQATECARSNEFSVEAVPNVYCPPVESASIQLEGPIDVLRRENIKPFTLFGDDSDAENVVGRAYQEGSYTIRTKMFSEKSLEGDLVVEDDFSFTVSDRCESQACSVEYILWNADSNAAIGALQDVECLRNNEFSIQAKPSSGCSSDGSASLRLEGPIDFSRTENFLPYTVFGDNSENGNVNGRDYKEGFYTIYTRLYSENTLRGVLEYEGSFSFAVTNC